jgi:predicted MFS family arabinose efflux permease
MILKAFKKYINNFKGFSREIWILTAITFINRAGTMVIPFLSKYLKEDLHFSYSEVGTILMFFGIGSVIGSWLGGRLSDKIGYYKIMIFSLLTSGVMLVFMQYIKDFYSLCFSMLVLMIVADMFRPAMFVSLGAYSTPETRTRALTLVRLAVNLGFATGPALGGLIIMTMNYGGLFWVDGITCILAILIFWWKVPNRKIHKQYANVEEVSNSSMFKDKPYWFFLFSCVVSGILFFQLFTTIPLYQKVQFKLSELQTGLLLTLNGGLVFLLEMILVNTAERKQLNKIHLNSIGILFMTLSMFSLLIESWAGILVIMMLFMTFGEMFSFPFSNSFAMSRAPKGSEGKYMGIFTVSYSLAHIFSSKVGMQLVHDYGYRTNWLIMGSLGILAVLTSYYTHVLVKKEKLTRKDQY